ncbi:hypothetical protein N480_09745 [Pseudoalteromonas luteoviolacea S2607]|uniref:TnsA endonuclease N-terminal domain-containing protein n=1 Tax=Pseudoalteromonas luteoviolacea TaxID=43657 RepID=UPI0007B163C2|nr:hypothetical protein N480_09745 [Pseudoalteromonas luteoviolacea S2607]
MTTDFYCQQINGKKVAYSIKDQKAFEKLTDKQKENLEAKQKLEKAFWESQGVKWYLVMSENIKTIFSQNLEQLYPSSSLSTSLKLIITRWQIRFFDLISERPKNRFSDILNSLASEFGIDYFDSVEIFQHCVWHRKIYANLSERLLEFEFSPNELGIRGVN